jgi:hypothetical protein
MPERQLIPDVETRKQFHRAEQTIQSGTICSGRPLT